ncbi:MAG: GAF domain-containing protein [Bacteroidia bacterium]|nr:GAF domain-containing protein [Bacteroidia bacterium]
MDNLEQQILQLEEFLRQNYAKHLDEFVDLTLTEICTQTNSIRGIFYVVNQDTQVAHAKAGYAINLDKLSYPVIHLGEGLTGEAIRLKQILLFNDLAPGSIFTQTLTINLSPKGLIIIPLIFNENVYGALELVSLSNYSETYLNYLQVVSNSITVTLQSLLNTDKMQRLLAEKAKIEVTEGVDAQSQEFFYQ